MLSISQELINQHSFLFKAAVQLSSTIILIYEIPLTFRDTFNTTIINHIDLIGISRELLVACSSWSTTTYRSIDA